MTTPLFYHPDQDCTSSFSFVSVTKIPEFVKQARVEYLIPEILGEKHFLAAHDPRYVRGVMGLTALNGFGNRDPGVLRSVLASNSNFMAAAKHALGCGIAASATQGFHHAHFDHGYGYCTFNGLMIAAINLLDRNLVERVLIIDGDGHHGDGTDDIIKKMRLGELVVNVTSDTMYGIVNKFDAADWRKFTTDLIERYKPGIIMYQAGADAWEEDPYDAGYLDELGMIRRDQGIMVAAKNAGVPLVWNLAGGYSTPMQKVIDIHLNTLMMSDRVYHGTIQQS